MKSFVFILIFFVQGNLIWGQIETNYLGISYSEMILLIGQPHSNNNSGYGETTYSYKTDKDIYIKLIFTALTNKCKVVLIEHPILSYKISSKLKNETVSRLKILGYKLYKEDTEDKVTYFSKNYFCTVRVSYDGGNHVGFDDFHLEITYFETPPIVKKLFPNINYSKLKEYYDNLTK